MRPLSSILAMSSALLLATLAQAGDPSAAESVPLFMGSETPPRQAAVVQRAIITANYAASVAVGFLLMLLVQVYIPIQKI